MAGWRWASQSHGLVELVGRGVAHIEQGGQGGGAGGAEFAFDAPLGAGPEQAAGNHGEGEGALAAGLVEEQGVEAEAAHGGEDGGNGAVPEGAAEANAGTALGGGELVVEGEAEQVDDVLREGGEVGQGAFRDAAIFPLGFGQQMAGSLAVDGGGDVHKRA